MTLRQSRSPGHILCYQVAVPINNALAMLRAAGAVLVPFDSSAFQELAVAAWPGATADSIDNLDASSDYESIEVLGRQVKRFCHSAMITDLLHAAHRE